MRVRDAVLSDLPDLLRGAKRMHGETRNRRFDYDEAKVSELFRATILDESGIALIAENQDKIVGGFLGMVTEHFWGRDKIACDIGIFVDKENRGTAASILLIKEYIQQAKDKGAVDIGLGTSTGYQPERVGKFYELLGFTEVGGNYRIEVLS